MIRHINFSQMRNKNLPTCLQGKFRRDSLGEFSSTSHGMFEAERVNINQLIFKRSSRIIVLVNTILLNTTTNCFSPANIYLKINCV